MPNNWAHKCSCGHTKASHHDGSCNATVVKNPHVNTQGLTEGKEESCPCVKFK